MSVTTATTDPLACALFLIGALALAGVMQVAWLASPASVRFAIPVDAGLTFRGHRLFGANKTLRGFIVMVPATAVMFPLVAFGFGGPEPAVIGLWPLTPLGYAHLGACAGLGFMLGELPNSFIKRQLGIAPGMAASGRIATVCQFAIDRWDSGVGMLTAVSLAVPTSWWTWVFAVGDRPTVALAVQRRHVRHRRKSEARVMMPESRTPSPEPRPARRSLGEGGSFILPLPSALDERQVGGKARNLARLIDLGQPVPEGFVVTNAALQCALLRQGGDAGVPRAALPADLIADLDFLHTVWQWDTVVVRSSAVGEDSACASFAGQLDSILECARRGRFAAGGARRVGVALVCRAC